MKRRSILFLGILIFAANFTQAEQLSPYLIIYAFSTEGQLLAKEMTVDSTAKILGRTIHIGKLSGKDIILAESGVGMTNAAMTVQGLIDRFHPRAVIFTGIAGGIDSTVHIGDIVVCRKWATHDYGYWGAEGFKPSPPDVYMPEADSIIEMAYLMTDSILFDKAAKLALNTFSFDSIGSHIPRLEVGGVGVSGNAFIDNVEKRQWLSANFGALVTDMESAAVAQVCTINGVPFIIFRSASDLAGGSGSATARTEIGQFFKVAAVNSARVVKEYLKEL
ncbi:MAG: 5'-methylthioadenosine/S-adenosylhomocysteine nucleosidase [candidate division Zixibacteria bacterium]|nr:5'-methylthioadenosine/S-adenosylhomocysteine nucleosidase [candidate division Zixibacteria bacterium]